MIRDLSKTNLRAPSRNKKRDMTLQFNSALSRSDLKVEDSFQKSKPPKAESKFNFELTNTLKPKEDESVAERMEHFTRVASLPKITSLPTEHKES